MVNCMTQNANGAEDCRVYYNICGNFTMCSELDTRP